MYLGLTVNVPQIKNPLVIPKDDRWTLCKQSVEEGLITPPLSGYYADFQYDALLLIYSV